MYPNFRKVSYLPQLSQEVSECGLRNPKAQNSPKALYSMVFEPKSLEV